MAFCNHTKKSFLSFQKKVILSPFIIENKASYNKEIFFYNKTQIEIIMTNKNKHGFFVQWQIELFFFFSYQFSSLSVKMGLARK